MPRLSFRSLRCAARLSALLLCLGTAAGAAPSTASLIAGARLAVAAEDYAAARATALEAWRVAESGEARFAAARLVALSEAALGHDFRARLWLRRAVRFAPSPGAEDSVAADYRYLLARDPLSVNAGLSVTPSDNLNNGTSRESFDLGPFVAEFVGDALPLSGLELVARADLSWRIAQTRRLASFLTFGAEARAYRLSEEAQETAPDAEGGDYASQQLTFGLAHNRAAGEGGLWHAAARAGWLRYAGEPYAGFAEVELGRDWRLGPADGLDLSVTARREGYDVDLEPERSLEVALHWSHALPNEGSIRLGGTLERQESKGTEQAYDGRALSADWRFGEGPAALHLDLERRDYDDARFGGPPREDLRRSLALDLPVPGADFYGFAPVLILERAWTDSTSARHDTEVTRLGLDIRSSF